jgi:DNA-binding transcriptional regulator LsrR (DeoR family)
VYDATGDDERRLVSRLGVCAGISGVLVDADGHPIHAELTDRMIDIGAPQLRAIPEIIAIAYGTAKTPAVRAAIRSGLVSGLVTHVTLASGLLAGG